MDQTRQLLENVPLLAGLDAELMNLLADGSEVVVIKKGDLVVQENDPGDALYIVISGRLQAYTRLKSGSERVYATYCNGDCFGEMPLLSGETHWASVRALNDSTLLKIPRTVFQGAFARDPRLAFGFTQRLGYRIKQLREDRHRVKWSTIISLCSFAVGAGKTLLAGNLAASLARETGEPVLLLDFSGAQPGPPLSKCAGLEEQRGAVLTELVVHSPFHYDRLALHLPGDEREVSRIAPFFSALVKRYDYVLVELPSEPSPSVFECLVQSDQVFVLVPCDSDALRQGRAVLDDLQRRAPAVAGKAKVILTGTHSTGGPCWKEATEVLGQPAGYALRHIPTTEAVEAADGMPYVLRQPMAPYSLVVRRIARELGNVLVGLALGTGAARGYAHIGVIRVLERAGIAVDVVAGSSMGALIAGAWAVGYSADDMEQMALKLKGKRAFFRLLDPIFPGAGIIRGLHVQEFLRQIVGDRTFAETLIPLKIVASELNTLEEIVFESGPILDAIRASISIPGVFRPVQNNGHVLIDGGITDPVPVNVLRRAGVTRVIAVNTIPNVEEMKHRQQRRVTVTGNTHETGPWVDTPSSIIDIYMRSMHAMQSRIAEDACADADVVIRPILSGGAWYDFYNPEPYIQHGEQAAEELLPQIRTLVHA